MWVQVYTSAVLVARFFHGVSLNMASASVVLVRINLKTNWTIISGIIGDLNKL